MSKWVLLLVLAVACDSGEPKHMVVTTIERTWSEYTPHAAEAANAGHVRAALWHLLAARRFAINLGGSAFGDEYDPVHLEAPIREVLEEACGRSAMGPDRADVIHNTPIDDLFAPDAVEQATSAGCGVLYIDSAVPKKVIRGKGVTWD